MRKKERKETKDMSKEEAGAISQELFRIDGKPSVSQALPLAMRHVVAMIVGCVTPASVVP